MKIVAVVVTYFPTHSQIENLIRSIEKQVNQIVVVDNTPVYQIHWKSILKKISFSKHVTLIFLNKNIGIAAAQNIGIKSAFKSKASRIVFFDQDSNPDLGMISNMLAAERELINRGISVGFLGPLLKNKSSDKYISIIKRFYFLLWRFNPSQNCSNFIEAEYVPSSGSMIKIITLKKIGLMKESFFIDWVDIEICIRAARFGFKHFVVNSAMMNHFIGDSSLRITRDIYLHNDIRNYYIVRNASNLLISEGIPFYWKINIIFKLPFYVIIYSLTSKSKNKFIVFRKLIQSIYQGLMGNLGQIYA